MDGQLRSRDLTTVEALKLLSGARFGRVVFARYALPTIRPVNHIVADDTIVINANAGITLSVTRQVVAFEADTIDHDSMLGWCVIVTGTAEEINDPQEIGRFQRLLAADLPGPRNRLIRIHTEIVTGIEYLNAASIHDPA
ncbi:pyridoxamine 5'-phosphate oxidase family protein [Nocardia pseudobrasiliensis]|uniref:Pyridoxamine 5'-phosphate oxidase-like protein n=1 Tax=Nocardia pseudobrasiliensis TaxID=45979 RepID=A0A370IBJ9_9NOCA|nr:pyridoxamine 5'-phosphate oxidase family protein [Nocardia pseudobrasiliensis]RDI68087.1 pyridoxamine 5'-phosphate oxidase-like protein [Nocardia pseudobrasiliensis]